MIRKDAVKARFGMMGRLEYAQYGLLQDFLHLHLSQLLQDPQAFQVQQKEPMV
jgi:hypothetical protein